MNLRIKVAHLEEWAKWQRRQAATAVQLMTDAELAEVITGERGISPEAITDEVLRAIIDGALHE